MSGSKFMFCGDWHGNTDFAVSSILRAKIDALGTPVTAILQLGDFGLWPGSAGEAYLEEVAKAAQTVKLPVYWVAGNHEWWDEIDRWTHRYGYDEPIQLAEYLYYLPNGCRFTLNGIKFGALGGAFSVDYAYRTPWVSWWPQECPTPRDLDRLGTDPLDILLTHDGPEKLQSDWVLRPNDEAKCDSVRYLIREAIRRTNPRRLYHGHWHQYWAGWFQWFTDEHGVETAPRSHQCWVTALAHDGDSFDNAAKIQTIYPNENLGYGSY